MAEPATQPEPPVAAPSKAEPDTTSTTSSRIQGFLRSLTGSPRLISSVLIILAVAAVAGLWDGARTLTTSIWWKVRPPASAIYVESPEVYTRERLINERSTEEAWLSEQLKQVDMYGSKASIFTRILDNINVAAVAGLDTGTTTSKESVASADGEASNGTSAKAGENELLSLTFDQNFKLLSAYRNLIRQRIIENRLDDRHDLEGNSLYILKFDSTVFGVPSVKDRAIIQVRLMPPPELSRLVSRDAESVVAALSSQPEIYQYANANFLKWRQSLQARINAAIRYDIKEFKSGNFWNYKHRTAVLDHLRRRVPAQTLDGLNLEAILDRIRLDEPVIGSASELVLEELYFYFAKVAVSKVTGDTLIDVDIKYPSSKSNNLISARIESPLARDYAHIIAKFEPKTSQDPVVRVDPLTSNVFLTSIDCERPAEGVPDYFNQNYVPERISLWQHFQYQIPSEEDLVAAIVRQAVVNLDHPREDASIFKFNERTDLFPNCTVAKGVEVQSGLINFTRKIGNFNTYSYSVLPRESPVSVYNEIALTTRAAVSFENAQLGRTRETRSTGWELRPVLTTFGNTVRITAQPDAKSMAGIGNLSKDTEPVVGWVIDISAQSPNEARLMSPVTMSESVVAIVSVPAWWSELVVRIDRGWLGSDTLKEDVAQDAHPITYFVKLPNRAELLDTLLFGAEGRQPLITGYDKEGAIMSNSCDELTVLVTGPRLWRNTAVTIGSSKADEIQVLPNMEGIIAKFRTRTGLPDTQAARNPATISGKLRVWTSDGMDETPEPIKLESPKGC